MNNENENIQVKTLVFNPSGFLLKMLFSIGFMVLFFKQGASDNVGFFMNLMTGGFVFVGCYFIATLFGFSLRATGNFIVAAIVSLIIFFALSAGLTYISRLGQFWNCVATLAAIGGLIWLPVRDIKKAILYYKNTV